MRVMVTGGAGFIGSNLVDALAVRGHVPGVVDDLSAGREENLRDGVFFRRLDILAPELKQVFAEFAPDAVVHLAAQADVQASIADPDRDWAVNVEGTRAVAAAAAACGATRVVSASSAAVYGDPETVPLRETAAKRPANPYGRSKLAAETALAEALAGSGADYASFRFANVYGPRQDWRGEGGVVAIFCARLAAGARPIVFGDGEQTRDFVFVGDVASALITAVESDGVLGSGPPDGPAYNVSTGVETSVLRLVEMLGSVSGAEAPPEFRPERPGEIDRSALDPSKSRMILHWTAAVPLEDGLAATWRHFRDTR
ncbi:MAG TPA: NAD-dependent epimerase/dehydratase family protein [Coriobacteriia bacterium]